MKTIDRNGITSHIPAICRNVCEKNEFYVDMIKDGRWIVSNKNKVIGVFSDIEDAMFFFMAESEPTDKPTEKDRIDAIDFLEKCLNPTK